MGTLILITSIERIVIGGGIIKRNGLIEKVRYQTRALLNGYLGELSDQEMREWITLSRYGSDAGLIGALVLARRAIEEDEEKGNDIKGESVIGSENKRSQTDPVMLLKRTAYSTGLWHGLALGLSVAYIGMVSYARSGNSSNRR